MDRETKVFVGNVPFQCTTDEFQNCFKDMDGFVNADIIRRHKSKLSRGFGFVIFDDKKHAQELMHRNNIILRDRELRFSPYTVENSAMMTNKDDTVRMHQIFVRDLDDGISKDQLKEYFSKYGEIVTCFVLSKNGRNNGIVSYKNYNSFKDAIEHEKHYEVYPYKRQTRKPSFEQQYQSPQMQKMTDPRMIYHAGYRDGHIVGFKQGFQDGVEQANKTKI